MNNSFDDVIVGAGIAGIVAGLVKAKQGRRVLLVDSAHVAGGLMKSMHTEEGYVFDYGTHLLSELAIEELDDLLFSEVRKGDWLQFDYLKSGHYIKGVLGEKSPVVDAGTMDLANYYKGLYELVETVSQRSSSYENLIEQLNCTFGSTITNQLIAPAVEKLFYEPASNLAPDSHLLFGLARVQGFSAESVRILKQFEPLNEALAFRSHHEGKTGQTRFYPSTGGIGQWVNILLEKLSGFGAQVLLGTQIESLGVENGIVNELTLSNGEQVQCNSLTWTVPLFGLLRLLPIELAKPIEPLKFLDSYLVHLIVDRAPITDLHYYCNYDPAFSHFRTTLYSNMQSKGDELGYRATVEVFRPNDSDSSKPTGDSILKELIDCGVFPSNSKVVYEKAELLKNSFPIPTINFRKMQSDQLYIAKKYIKNIELFGKARGDIFFMNDVIVDVYENATR